MLRKLRHKFILVNMLLVGLVLLVVVGGLIWYNMDRLEGQSEIAMRLALDWKDDSDPIRFELDVPSIRSIHNDGNDKRRIAMIPVFAVIVDEFGGTGGLVTLEDLVEEILGDFEDEHDRRTIVSEKIDDNTFEFSGRIEVETMNELYDLDLPENDEYQTLAGYILYNLEKLPQQGESFELDGYRFTVLKQSATKIELVRVERLEKNDEE